MVSRQNLNRELKWLMNRGFITARWDNKKKDWVFQITKKGDRATDPLKRDL